MIKDTGGVGFHGGVRGETGKVRGEVKVETGRDANIGERATRGKEEHHRWTWMGNRAEERRAGQDARGDTDGLVYLR